MLDRLRQVAQDLGLPFGDRRMTFNSRPAQELGKWAETQGQGDAFHLAAFKAYFADGLNIYRTDVLENIAASVGLDPKAAASVLNDGLFREAVDNDWARSKAMGITVVPTFTMAGEFIEGAQPYEAIESLLTRLGVPKRKALP